MQDLEGVDFALGGEVADLHGVLRSLRERGPVMAVRYFGEPAWILTTFEAVDAAYRDDDLFPAAAAFKEMTEPVFGRNLQCMHGAEHKRNRMLVSPSFRARVIPPTVIPIITEVANGLVDTFAGRGEADLVEDFNRVLPGAVITRLLGIPPSADVDFHLWAHQLLSFPSDPEGALAAKDQFTRFLSPLVAQRRADPRPDLISVLATTEIDGQRLSDEEIFSFVRLVFAAGTDTTFFGLGNALYALLTNPDQLEAVVADPDATLRWTVEETLRWESPVSMEPRRAPTATTWFGQEIEAGARLLFGIAAANRDPARFADPDRFDITRHPEPIMTFGIGAHFCLGAHLARAEIMGALGVMIERMKGLRLVDPGDLAIGGTVLRGPSRLPVRFTPR
jgi:cytochrome P450